MDSILCNLASHPEAINRYQNSTIKTASQGHDYIHWSQGYMPSYFAILSFKSRSIRDHKWIFVSHTRWKAWAPLLGMSNSRTAMNKQQGNAFRFLSLPYFHSLTAKVEMQSPYNPVTLLLSVCPNHWKQGHEEILYTVLIAAAFTTVKSLGQSNVHGYMNKLAGYYIYI